MITTKGILPFLQFIVGYNIYNLIQVVKRGDVKAKSYKFEHNETPNFPFFSFTQPSNFHLHFYKLYPFTPIRISPLPLPAPPLMLSNCFSQIVCSRRRSIFTSPSLLKQNNNQKPKKQKSN